MLKISYLIPTNRDYENFLFKTIESIKSNSSEFEYEILVFSQNEIKRADIVWVKEIGHQGPIYGFNKMVELSKGEYIVCLVDDHILVNSIKPTIDLLENIKESNKPIICSLDPGGPCFNPTVGQILGDKEIDRNIPKYPLIRFPVLHRKTLEILDGIIFHPNLFYHAGDIWLGFYLGYKFSEGFDGPTRIVPHNGQKNATWEVQDCNVVRELIYKLIDEKEITYSQKIF